MNRKNPSRRWPDICSSHSTKACHFGVVVSLIDVYTSPHILYFQYFILGTVPIRTGRDKEPNVTANLSYAHLHR